MVRSQNVIYSFVTFSSVLWLIWWVLIFAMCWTLYRTIRLPALRWIGLYYAVGIVAVPLMQYYGYRIAPSGHVPAMTSSGRLPPGFAHSSLCSPFGSLLRSTTRATYS